MSDKQYDIVVIGSGDAGKQVAFAAAKKQKKVAVVDKSPFGGTCALWGCTPKKILVSGIEIADRIRRFNDVGLHLGSGVTSWRQLQQWKEQLIGQTSTVNQEAFEKAGIDAYHGEAQFLTDTSVSVGEDIFHAEYIHIAVGSNPKPLTIQGAEFLASSEDFLNLPQLPKRIIFIGGGYISFELAHIAIRAGSEVMILHRNSQPLKEFDSDLVSLLIAASEKMGIVVKLNQPIVKLEKHGSSYVVFTQDQGREVRENADLVVHGAGRIPDIDSLNLEKGNVAYSSQGITVDKYLQSVSNPHVFAAGDVANTGHVCTPKVVREGTIAARNILHRTKQRIPDYTFIPSVLYTLPHLASAGYTEEEARAKGMDVDVYFRQTADWFHNELAHETFAAHKMIVQKKTGKIIGAHVLGEQADAIINLLSFAMQHKMTVDDIKKPLYAYSTATASAEYMFE